MAELYRLTTVNANYLIKFLHEIVVVDLKTDQSLLKLRRLTLKLAFLLDPRLLQ